TMTCAHFVLSLICLLSIAQVSSSLHQETRLISVNVGDNVTLQCFYQKDDGGNPLFFWYKQPLRQEPKIISIYSFDKKGTFQDEFKDKRRFTSEKENHSLILTISEVQVSDSATYYCAKSMHRFDMQFLEGTTVFVKDSNSFFETLVQQSDSETIHPGDSVTLKCTASTGSCDGEPSVYWFKNSEYHHPSLIYTQSDNSDQCERKTNKKHTCVYNLSLNNLNQSNAGTYYCAVTVCGRIVFGNGTKLELKGKKCCNMSNCLMIGYRKNTFIVKHSDVDWKRPGLRFRWTNHRAYVPRRLDWACMFTKACERCFTGALGLRHEMGVTHTGKGGAQEEPCFSTSRLKENK
uniref:Ig-like domain-containing protein n=1 Tax=Gouania willdenowi TaxID=441366 RepID=A0A8C5HKM5_GOUWI